MSEFFNDEFQIAGLQMGHFQMRGPELQVVFDPISTSPATIGTPSVEPGTGPVQFFQVPADRNRLRVTICGAGASLGGFSTPSRVMWSETTYNEPTDLVYNNILDTIGYGPDGVETWRLDESTIFGPYIRPPFLYSPGNTSCWVEFVLAVTPGEMLEIHVGHSGTVNASANGWPDGGPKGSRPSGNNNASAGGGSTSIRPLGGTFRDSLIVIGGAGGLNDRGLSRQSFYPNEIGYNGVGGGWAGLYQSYYGNNVTGESVDFGEATPATSTGGAPGTLVGPGLGGVESGAPYAGDDRFGGEGWPANNFGFSGGGGGGGWYGGGGGGPVGLLGGGSYGGEGGGGSSYLSSAVVDVVRVIDGIGGYLPGQITSYPGGRVTFFL